MSLLRLFCLTCVGLSGVAPTFAQTAVEGQIQGTVRDDSGAVLPGVTVMATGISTVGSARTVSDAEGNYRLVNLPPGEYQVEAELQGFSRFSQGGVQVRAARTILLDVILRIGSIEETVTVTAETPMLEVRRAVQAINIEGEFQRELPLSPRRDYTDFLEVTPGMNNYVNPQSGGGIYHLRGSTIESHVVQLDGADMTSFRQARPDYIALSSDALEDVEIKTAAADASSPLGVGVVINVVSKSGTNTLTGSAGLVFADTIWNADNNPEGESTTADIFQQDVSVGGPIVADKAWFYGTFRNVARDVGINRTEKELALHQVYTPGWEPFDNQFRGKSIFAKLTTQVNPYHKLDGFYQWDSYTTENIVPQDNASYRPQDYAGIGVNARLTSLWSDSLTTRFTVSYNDKSLNGSVGAYDGHLCFCPEQGPGVDVHEGVF
ncbi:MAG: carboxypeptidase regulatory-like domain-containing protein, partial [Gammaproteobacteria bacterium]